MLMLTPQQITQVTQLSDQTLRHWRVVLPPLAGLTGYKPCFSSADALALMVVRYLVKVMGIRVGALATTSIGVFSLCRSTSWSLLVDHQIVVNVERGEVSLLTREVSLDAPAVIVPMRPFVEKLQAAWTSSFPSRKQLSLLVPAEVVSLSVPVAVGA